MKIVFTDSHTMNPGDLSWSVFDGLGDIEIFPFTSQEDLYARVVNADIIVSNKTILSGDIIKRCENVQLICVSATGFNNIDVDVARELNIPVCNAADYSSHSVAQHVFASVLKVYNNIAYYSDSVHDGRWQKSRDFTFYDEPIEELFGKNLGIIGYGNIGKRVAEIGVAFGMNLKVLRHPKRDTKIDRGDVLDLQEFLSESDVVSIHIPLRNETESMVNRDFLQAMKKSAILVNTARGPIVDELALKNALTEGWIRAACIDVLPVEPPVESHLIGLDNCIITPHQAWASRQSRIRLMEIVADNISAFKKGELRNKVN